MRFGRVFLLCFIISAISISFFLVQHIVAAPGTSSLVGYWKLDESIQGSNATDSSGYGNTGSPHGTGSGPSPSTDVTFTTFPDSHSASFNGTDQYIEVADASNLDPTSAVTISAWIKLAAADSSYHTIAGKWYTGTHQQYLIQINSDGKLGFWTGDGSTCADDLESTGAMSAGSWIHIVGVQSGTAKKLYINGTQNNTKTSGCSLGSSTALFGIGSKYNGSAQYFEFFNGKIDDVRVYSRALSSAEVSDLAHGNHTTATWTGSSSINFETAGNWDINAIPEPFTKFVIPSTTNKPSLSVNEQFGGVTINSGGILNLAGFNLTMNDYVAGESGLATSSGTIISKNSETLTNFVLPTNSGTVMYNNTSDATGLLFGNTYNNLIFNDSMLGYWKLDESSGNATDSSGFNATLTNSNVTYTTGKFNNAASFNGTNAGFSATGPNLANSSFTISGWIYANNLNADQTWFELGSASSTDKALHLRLTSSGGVRMGFFSDDLDTASGIISAGRWYQVIYTYNTSNKARAIYINGVSKASGTAGSNFSGDTSMTLGSWQGSERWNGLIDDVRVYNRVLSASEIANLAAGTPPATSLATTTLNHDLTVNGNLLLNSGTLDVSSSNYNITDSGNFDNNGGVFTPRSGTVSLTGTSQSINGGTSFYNLTKSVSSADTLTFAAGFTSTTSGTLTLTGVANNLLSLRSSTTGTQFKLDPQGSRSITYVDVQDANNTNSTPIAYSSTNTLGTNLTNWATPTPTPSSSGGSSSDSNTVVPTCQNLPTVSAPTIFAASSTTNSVTLNFTPVDAVSRTYYIYYGTDSDANTFATSYVFSNPTGAGQYTINNLTQGQTYYFKIQAGNGCTPGPFSTIVSVTTQGNIVVESTQLARELENTPITKPLKITKSTLSATTPTPAPKKIALKKNADAGYSLDVAVKDSHGNPLAGATVTLHSKMQQAISDGKGIAHFTNIEEGNHTILLAYNGYSGQQQLTVNGVKKDLTLTLQVQLTSGAPWGLFMIVITVFCIIIGFLLFIIFKRRKSLLSRFG